MTKRETSRKLPAPSNHKERTKTSLARSSKAGIGHFVGIKTETDQARLEAWTKAILQGVPASELRAQIG
jgi:hypothetical protein